MKLTYEYIFRESKRERERRGEGGGGGGWLWAMVTLDGPFLEKRVINAKGAEGYRTFLAEQKRRYDVKGEEMIL